MSIKIGIARIFGIIGAIVLTLYIISMYVPGGVAPFSTLRNFVSWAMPIAAVPATALFIKAKWGDYSKGKGEVRWLALFYITIFFIFLVWGNVFPGQTFDDLFQLYQFFIGRI